MTGRTMYDAHEAGYALGYALGYADALYKRRFDPRTDAEKYRLIDKYRRPAPDPCQVVMTFARDDWALVIEGSDDNAL